MKKSLIALAVLTAAGAASAQSSVTLFGVVDATVRSARGAGNGQVTSLTTSGQSTSRIGFRGTEDLGGGMSASFWLEGGLGNDDGTAGGAIAAQNQARTVAPFSGMNFNRRSTVSLAGGWGELRLGRDYVPSFWNLAVFDPFGAVGVGAANNLTEALALPLASTAGLTAATAARASNTIGYLLPGSLGGFYGQFMYALGENASNVGATKDDGRHVGLRVGFASGPFNVAVGYGRTKLAAQDDYRTLNVGGQWSFGMLKLVGQINREATGLGVANAENRSWLLGVLVPVGAGLIRASYIRAKIDTAGVDPSGAQIAVGYVHDLSKRTAIYTTYARTTNKDGGQAFFQSGRAATTVNGSSSGLDVGIRHNF
ncbi:MAG: gram-negative porin family protein [Ramlibacter sp.]|nr:gram-negative porin family protein [Ramlibacter sp.]